MPDAPVSPELAAFLRRAAAAPLPTQPDDADRLRARIARKAQGGRALWWLRAAIRARHLPLRLALKVAASGYAAERGWRYWPW